jgi:ribonuclease P protein component
MRVSGRSVFAALRAATVRAVTERFIAHALPNECGNHRLGLAVSRRIGSAVKRHRVKRLLREAFRLSQHELPGSYDLLITVRPHEEAPLHAYQQALAGAVNEVHAKWRKKQDKSARGSAPSRPL